MISISHKGNFNKIESFLKESKNLDYLTILNKYGREGVSALSLATPIDSGETAKSWDYKITHDKGRTSITWTNSNIINGTPVAILIQYGHATRNGGYIQGRDYINPAIRPIFDKLANDIWKEVNK